jgi:hypothetical protein
VRQDEDENLVKEAKNQLSKSKKELKSVVKLQTEQLYEAMCVQRSWPQDDWRRYLCNHPIVGLLCQAVVWQAFEPGTADAKEQSITVFRPLDDGSLTDVNDEEVTLTPHCRVRIAHDCNTSAELGRAWLAHLQDYEVQSLFGQFGKTEFTLKDEQKDETHLKDKEGHLLEAFKLRGLMNKLGYTRGQAEDGGWFYCYLKHFPTLELQAVIEFTGNSLPEENRTVALRSLSFIRNDPELTSGYYYTAQSHLPLGQVPEVLLGECWNDVCRAGELGSGFDSDWEKKCAC